MLPNAGKATKTGISFKLMPWLHQWYYFPDQKTPAAQDIPKPKRAKRSSKPNLTLNLEEDSVA